MRGVSVAKLAELAEPEACRNAPLVVAAKKPMHVELTRAAHDGWFYVPNSNEATMTSLAEVIGLELVALRGVPFGELPRQWRDRLAKAQRVYERNRSEQGKRK